MMYAMHLTFTHFYNLFSIVNQWLNNTTSQIMYIVRYFVWTNLKNSRRIAPTKRLDVEIFLSV